MPNPKEKTILETFKDSPYKDYTLDCLATSTLSSIGYICKMLDEKYKIPEMKNGEMNPDSWVNKNLSIGSELNSQYRHMDPNASFKYVPDRRSMAMGSVYDSDVSDLDNEGQEDDEQPKSFLEYDENRNIVGLVHDRELNDFDEDNGVWLPKNPIISENYALGINENAFNGCNRLTKIICQNVTTIGASAFANCSQLQSIKFPSVSTVSNDAFNLCVKLENVELPNVTFLNYGAFSHCYRLEKIYLPSLVTLKRDVFNACVTLSQVDFPNAETTDIGTFAGCYGL